MKVVSCRRSVVHLAPCQSRPATPLLARTHTELSTENCHRDNHTRLTALCPGLPRWAGTRKVKAIWILLKRETVSDNGISWAKTTPAPHHSVFYRPDVLPATQPTTSKHGRTNCCRESQKITVTINRSEFIIHCGTLTIWRDAKRTLTKH